MAKDDMVERITRFLAGIGMTIRTERLSDPTFLPAMTVRRGALVFDPDRLVWPGDLLHEAGHIAVTHPDLREALDRISDDGGEEMAAIAWSYAAALEIGMPPALLFHDGGYRGDGGWLVECFASGYSIGAKLLQWFGMTREARHGEVADGPCYPRMVRWLR